VTEGRSDSGDRAGHRRGIVFALLLLACALAYVPGLGGPLFFDDIPNLGDNTLLDFDGRRFDDWRAAVLSNDSGVLHRPVAMLSFAANRVAAGELSPLALKGTNLAIHLAIGALLYSLFLALLAAPALAARLPERERPLLALLGAALWLLHPLHVSTVLYAVQRMTQLSALFTVAGLLLFTRYRLRWAARGAGAGELLAAALWLLLLGAAAVLSKENGALLPWLLVVVEVCLFRGLWAGAARPWLRRGGWLLLALPLLLVALLFTLDPGLLDVRYARREFSLEERLLTQARLLWHYLGWLALPDIRAMGFFHDDIAVSRGLWSPPTTALALAAWAGALLAALALRRRLPLLLFALLFFLVGHSLESSVWPLELVFEHRNYLPAMGPALLLAAALVGLSQRLVWWRPPLAGAVLCLLLALLLGLRAWAWSDDVTLARQNVVNHPDSPRANFFYGQVLFDALERGWDGGFDETQRRAYAVAARRHFLRMHELDPRDMAAPVMLYQMDRHFFPGLPDAPDWLALLQRQARERPLQPSDRTALRALVRSAASAEGADFRPRVMELLLLLHARYPGRAWLYELRYQLLAAGGAPLRRDLALELLLEGIAARPTQPLLYPYLVQHHGTAELGASYEAIGHWLRHDTLQRQMPQILELFRR